MYQPTKEQFIARAQQGVLLPVYYDLPADWETPVSAFYKVARDSSHAFLLESVSGGERVARYSFIGLQPRLILCSKGRTIYLQENGSERVLEVPEHQTPLDGIRTLLRRYRWTGGEGLPPFSGGAVGYVGYDMVRFFERLPELAEDDLQTDDCCFMFPDVMLIFDHVQHKIRVLMNAVPGADPAGAYDDAIKQIEVILQKLRMPLPPPPRFQDPAFRLQLQSNVSRERFMEGIERAKEYIHAGDCVQVVLSQRMSTPITAPPFNIYRALRSLNPSPYMFYLRLGEITLVGASPEILVSVEGRQAVVRPIAGTRKRGTTEAEDLALESELLADEKERAEHIMLVDLGRNDLGRVCRFGSVQLHDLMVVERYSHVMHIVSEVRGELRADQDVFDVLRACFPAGTVSGAPKVRAMEIIEELEPTRRGPYAGAVGHFSLSGDMDMCITIRTILLKDGIAYVQVGAGIVADSVPESEYQECINKATAALRAIEQAHSGQE
jgi:anthranilate synthase component 1